MTRLTAKSSTIFIANGEGTQVFQSLEEIPPALRQQLEQSTHGINSATILIADKRGRQELVRALQGQSSDVQCHLADNLRAREQKAQPPARISKRIHLSFRTWIGLLLPVAIGASLWLLIGSRL